MNRFTIIFIYSINILTVGMLTAYDATAVKQRELGFSHELQTALNPSKLRKSVSLEELGRITRDTKTGIEDFNRSINGGFDLTLTKDAIDAYKKNVIQTTRALLYLQPFSANMQPITDAIDAINQWAARIMALIETLEQDASDMALRTELYNASTLLKRGGNLAKITSDLKRNTPGYSLFEEIKNNIQATKDMLPTMATTYYDFFNGQSVPKKKSRNPLKRLFKKESVENKYE